MSSAADNNSSLNSVSPASSEVLSSKLVLVAASAKLLPELTARLQIMGAVVIPFPVLQARELEDRTALDQAITRLDQYDWIIFTSAYGVTFFDRRLRELARYAKDAPRVCAIGPATGMAARDCGFSVALTATKFIAEGVMASLEQYHGGKANLKGLRILIPRAVEAREFLPEALAGAGCHVDIVPCYQTIRPEPDRELVARLHAEIPDLIVFTSAKTVRNFWKTTAAIVGEERTQQLLHQAVIAVIGPITGEAVREHGKTACIIPAESTVTALCDAIRKFFLKTQGEEFGCPGFD